MAVFASIHHICLFATFLASHPQISPPRSTLRPGSQAQRKQWVAMSIMKLPRVAWMALTSNLNVLLHLDQSNPKPKHQQFLLAYGTITTKKNQVHACAAILTSTHACFQLVDLTCHAVTMLMDKDNTTSNYRANKPAQPKLKIRAAVSSQGNIR